MANYVIIGGDGREYGPISADDLHKWIAEGRLNAQSPAKGTGDAEFRPLAAFPEFAAELGGGVTGSAPFAAPPAFPSGGDREAALSAVKGPAIALIVTASLGILYYLSNFVLVVSGTAATFQQIPPDAPDWVKSFIENARGPMAAVAGVFISALDGFVLYGAIKMLRLQNFGLAMAAAIIAMVPCQCCCLLGLPFGIWALVVLNKPEVKSQFR